MDEGPRLTLHCHNIAPVHDGAALPVLRPEIFSGRKAHRLIKETAL